MRDELRELLGKSVVLEGRLNRCEPNAIGSLNICLKAVNVYPWRTDVAISSLSPLRVDHGWLQNSRLEHSVGGIVEMYWMTAEITNYQRKNGSRDIGFRHRPSLCLDHLLDKITNADKRMLHLKTVKNGLERIQNTHELFGFYCSPRHTIRILQQTLYMAQQIPHCSAMDYLVDQILRMKKQAKLLASTNQQGSKMPAAGFLISY